MEKNNLQAGAMFFNEEGKKVDAVLYPDSLPETKFMSKEDGDALMKKWMSPEYMKERYDNIDAACKFMDLCSEGNEWIMAIHDYCNQQGIEPKDLIEFHKQGTKKAGSDY